MSGLFLADTTHSDPSDTISPSHVSLLSYSHTLQHSHPYKSHPTLPPSSPFPLMTHRGVQGDYSHCLVGQTNSQEPTPLLPWGNTAQTHAHHVSRHLLAFCVLIQLARLVGGEVRKGRQTVVIKPNKSFNPHQVTPIMFAISPSINRG